MVEQTREGRGEEQAAAALANLARESEENRNSIVNSNGIPPLLALIDSPNAKVGVLRPKEKREERRGEGMGSLPPATPQQPLTWRSSFPPIWPPSDHFL